jgi:16S rRNA (guanine527-N7)-methyltransferase
VKRAAEGRLLALGSRYGIDPEQVDALRTLLCVVARDPTAPTTVTDPDAAVDVHIADSLVGLDVEAIRSASMIADLGAGAGFPGLALASVLPRARVAEVESVGKKCAFMRRAAEAAGLGNVEVVHARAEEWRPGFGRYDVVTARALAPLNVLVEYAAPLLRPGGVLVAWKGARDAGEERAGDAAAAEVGLGEADVRAVAPYEGVDHRHLYLYSKVGETPSRFPRRAGMARKRPLGRST